MRCITVLLCLVAAVSACSMYDVVEQEWVAFKLEHNKIYDDEVEDRFRMKIYVENNHNIAKHNQLYRKGLVSYSLKQNQYGDMLPHEFTLAMNGFNNKTVFSTRGATFLAPAHASIPDQADWTKKGAVTEVKNQQRCGSCWAFSATGALEGQHYRKTGYLVSLSEQNLIDCSSPYGNDGCNGGHMIAAFIYVKANGGIDTEKSYPYEGTEGQCRYNPKNSGADDVGFVRLPSADEKALMQAVATVGPVSVAIDASQKQFMFYSGGVYFDKGCSSYNLNHGVLVVGYGTDEVGGDYWLVKNSWGRSWGDLGYIKMARNRKNHCGIATDASYPLV